MIRQHFQITRGLRKGREKMNALLNILKKIIIFTSYLIIIPASFYYFFTYTDLIFSFLQSKKNLHGRIVYSIENLSNFNIKVIGLPSNKKRDLYTSPPRGKESYLHVNSFSFSKDGQKIVFSRWDKRNNEYKLYTMNSDGTGIKELLNIEGVDEKCPSLSPNKEKVAFIVQKNPGYLYIANLDKPYSSLRILSNIRPATYTPTWSPDGKKISFVSDERLSKRISERWRVERFVGKTFIINSDGTNLRQLEINHTVSWSPDGKMLLYRGEEGYYISDENQFHAYLLIPYKRPPVKLFFNDPSFVVWSPDGKYIAYVKEIWPGLGAIGIYIVSLDNPKKQICVAVENSEISDMVWVK